ncbi:MAG TPA: DEAD/DEAH box helicase [Pirellulales bacterium]|nr:DEAD/DEAH box helicase [Pirellulales bacterium]
MTVPTGGGKTLSALAFAFEHARRNNLRRVIYVAPYLSILEQNVREIRRALDVDATSAVVFEHHSLSEPLVHDDDIDAAQTSARLMRAENWDAPVVVTTNVQFFESLFANQPGRCRKLHNIARSVVVLDECQILPPHLIAPTCGMLNQWAQSAGSSLVLCTATQPAWLQRPNLPTGLVAVREIAPAKLELFRRLRRSKVEWPQPTDQDWEWSAVAARMQTELAALCVVNTIKAARDALDVLRQSGCLSALHLSAHMCPAHRLQVIDEVRRRLAAGEPCHLVSTQLIEAGVDVDFPLVLRELAPFETVIQAAGRCNREGLLNTPGGEPGGKVVVFRSRHGGLPPGWYKRGTEVLEHLLNDGQPPNIDRPEDIQAYFQRLYLAGDLDSHEIHDHRQAKRFQLVAERYRLIEGESQPVVVLNWWARQAEIETLLKTAERQPSRLNLRRLTPFQVNIARWKLASARPLIDETTWNVAVWNGPYDETLGIELQGGADYVV